MGDRNKGTLALGENLVCQISARFLLFCSLRDERLSNIQTCQLINLVNSTCLFNSKWTPWIFSRKADVSSRPTWREMPGGVHVSQCQTVATFYSNHFSALLPSALSLSLCGEKYSDGPISWSQVAWLKSRLTQPLIWFFLASRVFRQRRMLSGNLCVPQRRGGLLRSMSRSCSEREKCAG